MLLKYGIHVSQKIQNLGYSIKTQKHPNFQTITKFNFNCAIHYSYKRTTIEQYCH